MTEKEKTEYLTEAFSDESFRKILKNIRLEIEDEIKKFIKYYQKQNENYPEKRVFSNPESRIKGIESFTQKIKRKCYIDTWNITNDIEHNKEIIRTHLPDLIGTRINCFFEKDEKDIYDSLVKYAQNEIDSNKISFNYDENHRQKNGHNLYKITGIYTYENAKYNFEIQVKSIMHNLWGEVEHRTIYKGRKFDPNVEHKKTIIEEIFNILRASDKQLLSLFNNNYNEYELVQAMYFEKTYKFVKKAVGTDILANSYESFFKIFFSHSNYQLLKKYVAKVMLEEKWDKKEVITNISIYPLAQKLKEKINQDNDITPFDLRLLYEIANQLWKIDTFDEFLNYLCIDFTEKLENSDEIQENTIDQYDYENIEMDNELEDISEDMLIKNICDNTLKDEQSSKHENNNIDHIFILFKTKMGYDETVDNKEVNNTDE